MPIQRAMVMPIRTGQMMKTRRNLTRSRSTDVLRQRLPPLEPTLLFAYGFESDAMLDVGNTCIALTERTLAVRVKGAVGGARVYTEVLRGLLCSDGGESRPPKGAISDIIVMVKSAV